MTREEYIAKFSPLVVDAVKGTPLFASLMMAQALLESSDRVGNPGNGILTRKGKNHFGIKADPEWQGERILLITQEVIAGERQQVKAWFRVYDDDAQSFKDRVAFLLKNKRYYRNGVFKMPSPPQQAKALQQAGYATDPRYAEKLIHLMEKHNLYSLDHPGPREILENLAILSE